MRASKRRGHVASFAMRRAWELLPTPNAHRSPRELDESEDWVPVLGAPAGVQPGVLRCRKPDGSQELF